MSKIVLITGATAGIGRATALHLASRGHHVIATGRKVAELVKLQAEAESTTGKLDTIALDVTSAGSIALAVEEVARLTGGYGLDVLVNNAGYGAIGPTSEIGDAELRRQYDTNVFGLMAVTRAFLPQMRERGHGRIINVSSVGGRFTMPFFGVYNSTKYAVESLSDAMRYELRPFGIDVTLIEPGVIRTNFEATAVSSISQYAASPYAGAMKQVEAMSKTLDRFAAEPIVIAKAIDRAVRVKRPAARYVAPRFNSVVIALKTVLPTRMFDWTMRRMSYLTKEHLGIVEVKRAEAKQPVAPVVVASAPN